MQFGGKPVICMFGDYDPDYPREAVIKAGLENNGVMVLECNCRIKYSGSKVKNKAIYTLKAYISLLQQFRKLPHPPTCFIVPHNNHLVVPLAWCLARRHRMGLTVDAFDPAYHTALMLGEHIAKARLRYYLEKLALSLADKVLVATEPFKRLFCTTYRINEGKVFILPDSTNIQYRANGMVTYNAGASCTDFLVVYWGNFHPHHGVNIIIQAARLLVGRNDIKFLLAGRGHEYENIRRLVRDWKLSNVQLLGYLSDRELIGLIKKAHVCLGIFSGHILARGSVTNKVMEGLALGKAVITEQNAATTAAFRDREEILLVPPEDPEALARAILFLYNDENFRRQLEENAAKAFRERFSEVVIGRRLLAILEF